MVLFSGPPQGLLWWRRCSVGHSSKTLSSCDALCSNTSSSTRPCVLASGPIGLVLLVMSSRRYYSVLPGKALGLSSVQVSEQYTELVNFIIRPPRDDSYTEADLGPPTFPLGRKTYKRTGTVHGYCFCLG